ncbi:MAG: O-antigen ligase family protein, partial [Steroidobacteraceae bacterium]
FLMGRRREKVVVLCIMPFIVNGLVTTISRSGFLELAIGGVTFNWFTPKKLARLVRVLSILAILLFMILTGPSYWKRMQSIEHAGEQVHGVNTGEDRIALFKAQWRMFAEHPLGCGAMCTAVLSPEYLEQKYLASAREGSDVMERASHSTFMSMLVEHGIPGVVFYLILLVWTYRALRRLAQLYGREGSGPMPTIFPAIAAIMAAITVGDLFVSYMKFEIRIWFIAILIAMFNLAARERAARAADDESRAAPTLSRTATGPLPLTAHRYATERSSHVTYD